MGVFQEQQHSNSETVKKVLVLIAGIFVFTSLIAASIYLLNKPPKNFPEHSSIIIEKGMSVAQIVSQFEATNYVRSADLLHFFILLQQDDAKIRAGSYYFEEAQSTAKIAEHIISVGPSDPLVAITFPEGMTVRDFARIAKKSLPNFDVELFTTLADEYEGELFPDTYYVTENFSENELLLLLHETYTEKLSTLTESIINHDLSEDEIIILASIIEREANSADSMKMVSGILQNRLSINMALQADASIEYTLDKPLSELTPEDLTIDSPYNTYLYPGLPPTPIGNPGLDAITAVLEPTVSDNFYYITDSDGAFHYARTFDEHKLNIARYLR